jgi:hypothetical protein
LKKLTSIFLAAFFGLVIMAASIPTSAQMSMQVRIGPMPPPRAEVIPVAPGPYYHWDAGHWRWWNGGWRWVPGHYVHGYAGARWIPGHYRMGPNGYRVWVAGHWR